MQKKHYFAVFGLMFLLLMVVSIGFGDIKSCMWGPAYCQYSMGCAGEYITGGGCHFTCHQFGGPSFEVNCPQEILP